MVGWLIDARLESDVQTELKTLGFWGTLAGAVNSCKEDRATTGMFGCSFNYAFVSLARFTYEQIAVALSQLLPLLTTCSIKDVCRFHGLLTYLLTFGFSTNNIVSIMKMYVFQILKPVFDFEKIINWNGWETNVLKWIKKRYYFFSLIYTKPDQVNAYIAPTLFIVISLYQPIDCTE